MASQTINSGVLCNINDSDFTLIPPFKKSRNLGFYRIISLLKDHLNKVSLPVGNLLRGFTLFGGKTVGNKKIKSPPLYLIALELRAIFRLPLNLINLLTASESDIGKGQPVLVLPGFTGNDLSTAFIRYFLNKVGFKAEPWRLGINFGYSKEVEEDLTKLIFGLYYFYNTKISIVGWSLGGVLGRELAKRHPDKIKQVITLGSPFVDINTCTNIRWLYQLLATLTGRCRVENVQQELLCNLHEPPPVKTTSVYSKNDGIVSWEGCLNDECESAENIQVTCQHLGFISNPTVLNIVTSKLVGC